MSSSRPRSGLLAGRLLFALLLLLSVLPAPDVAFSQAPDCQAETEPNNTEAEVQAVEGAFCIAGDLPEVADQDLFLWTVSDEDAKFIWTMTVAGPVGVVTSAKLLTLSSEPGVDPIVAGTQIAEVGTTPESDAPVSSSFLMTPGRYLVGISRTDSTTGPPLTTTYELALAQSSRLPKRLDDEPNDAADTASPVSGAFETAGDALETIDTYAWTLTDDEAALGWELHVQVALGQSISLTVTTDPLAPYLVSTASNQQGRIDLYDLALEPGTYFLQLSPGATAGLGDADRSRQPGAQRSPRGGQRH
jgi:hypothetical protein